MTPVCLVTWLVPPPAQRRTAAAALAQRVREGFDPSEFVAVDLWLCRRYAQGTFLAHVCRKRRGCAAAKARRLVREEPPCAFGVPSHACAVRSDAARSGGGGRGPATRARLYHCRGIEADHCVQGPEGRRTFLYWFAQSETSRLVRSAVASATHRSCPPCKAAPLPHALIDRIADAPSACTRVSQVVAAECPA